MGISSIEHMIVAIYYCLLGGAGLFANILLIIVLCKHKEHRTRPSTSYLYSILFASVLASLFQVPYFLHNILADLPPPFLNAYDIECRFAVFLSYAISIVKIFLLSALSIDRYIAVAFPYFYNKHMTRVSTGIANVFFWTLPVLLMIPISAMDDSCEYIGTIGSSCGVVWSEISVEYSTTLILIAYIIPCTAVAITNIKVFKIARKQKSVIASEAMRFSGKRDVVMKDVTLEEPTELKKESIAKKEIENTATKVGPQSKSQMETDIRETSLSEQESETYSLSSEIQSISLTGNSSQEQKENTVEKSEGIKDRALAQPVRKNYSNCIKNTSESETRIDRTREVLTVKEEENLGSQERHKSIGKKILHRNDWGLIFSTLMLAVAFFVTWTPFAISRAYEIFIDALNTRSTLYPAAITLMDIILNPFIIIGTRPKLRKQCKQLLCFN